MFTALSACDSEGIVQLKRMRMLRVFTFSSSSLITSVSLQIWAIVSPELWKIRSYAKVVKNSQLRQGCEKCNIQSHQLLMAAEIYYKCRTGKGRYSARIINVQPEHYYVQENHTTPGNKITHAIPAAVPIYKSSLSYTTNRNPIKTSSVLIGTAAINNNLQVSRAWVAVKWAVIYWQLRPNVAVNKLTACSDGYNTITTVWGSGRQ